MHLLVAGALVAVLGWLSGRALGVRTGPWRGLLAGVVGAAVGLSMSRLGARFAGGEDVPVAEATVTLVVGLLTAMGVSLALDSVRRDATEPFGLLAPWTRLRQRLTVASRVRQIIGHARSRRLHRMSPTGLLESPEGARAVRLFLEDCGGLFVKFGQIASTRSDLLPAALIEELGALRGTARPLSFDVVAEIVAGELDRPTGEVFADLDPEPLGSASIGQTHRATLHDGTPVIVKVRRPGIEQSFARDAAVLRWAAAKLDRTPSMPVPAGEVAEELIRSVAEEMDFRVEARNLALLHGGSHQGDEVRLPRLFPEYSTEALLVEEAVVGSPVGSADALATSPVPPEELARRLLRCLLRQVLVDGVYHADPHPGNVLLDDGGRLWLIDFGATGFLGSGVSSALRAIALGVAADDATVASRGIRDLVGSRGDALDMRVLERDVDTFLSRSVTDGLDPRLVADIVDLLRRNGVEPPTDLTLLGRALGTLSGTLTLMAPEFSFTEEAEAIARADLADATDWAEEARREVLRTAPALRALPELSEAIARQLRAGTLAVRVDPLAGGTAELAQAWIDRALFTTVAGAGLVTSAILLVGSGLSSEPGAVATLRAIGLVGLVVSSAMLMRVVGRVLRRGSLHD